MSLCWVSWHPVNITLGGSTFTRCHDIQHINTQHNNKNMTLHKMALGFWQNSGLSDIMPSVVMPNVTILSVVMVYGVMRSYTCQKLVPCIFFSKKIRKTKLTSLCTACYCHLASVWASLNKLGHLSLENIFSQVLIFIKMLQNNCRLLTSPANGSATLSITAFSITTISITIFSITIKI